MYIGNWVRNVICISVPDTYEHKSFVFFDPLSVRRLQANVKR